jgi:hypothetical protein
MTLPRLLDRERRRHPEYDELTLYAAVSGQVERVRGSVRAFDNHFIPASRTNGQAKTL